MTSSVDTSPDVNKQPTKWTSISKSGSTKPPRVVDRELQRIKNLAMVSGISRSFTQEPQSITIVSSGPSPTPSVSSSTSYGHRPATIASFPDVRLSRSVRSQRSCSSVGSSHHSRAGAPATTAGRNHRRLKQAELDAIERELIGMFEDAYRTQHEDRVEHWVSTVGLGPASEACPEGPDRAGLSSSLGSADSTKSTRPRRDSVMSTDADRLRAVEAEYATAIKRLEEDHGQWARHVQEVLTSQAAEKEAEARKARQLAELVVYQEQVIAEMQRDLDRRDDIQELERTRDAVRQLWPMIDSLTEAKTVIERGLDRVQHDQDAGLHALVQTQAGLDEVAAEVEIHRIQIAEKIEAMKRELEKKEEDRMSIRSSSTTTSRGPRTARYTGGPLPPPAPPPTDPLPPVPVNPPSVYSSSSIITHDPVFDDQHSERAYREFAEQVQTRLSVSKEIDDLQLWHSEDLEEFERRIHEKYKDVDPDKRQNVIQSLRSKEGATFWRGMKKKLRV